MFLLGAFSLGPEDDRLGNSWPHAVGNWQMAMAYLQCSDCSSPSFIFTSPDLRNCCGPRFSWLTRSFRRSFGSGLQVEQMSEPANELDGNSCVYLTKGSRITTKHKACCIPKSDPLPELLPPKTHGTHGLETSHELNSRQLQESYGNSVHWSAKNHLEAALSGSPPVACSSSF